MPKSCGILVFRKIKPYLEYLLVFPGGPFYKNEEEKNWTIPKGEQKRDESFEVTAKREFEEETGFKVNKKLLYLGEAKLRRGKRILVFGMESDYDVSQLKSNNFEMEYPKGSGELKSFPEIQKGGWYTKEEAKRKIHPKLEGYLDMIEQLADKRGKP